MAEKTFEAQVKDALGPFARAADWLNPNWRNHEIGWGAAWLNGEHASERPFFPTVGDLRRARDLLKKIPSQGVSVELDKPLDQRTANQPTGDPRITDQVVKAAATAGLKSPPSLDEFTRAILTEGLRHIETVDNSLTDEVDRLRADLDSALAVIAACSDPNARLWVAANYPEFVETNPGKESAERIQAESKAEVQSALSTHTPAGAGPVSISALVALLILAACIYWLNRAGGLI